MMWGCISQRYATSGIELAHRSLLDNFDPAVEAGAVQVNSAALPDGDDLAPVDGML